MISRAFKHISRLGDTGKLQIRSSRALVRLVHVSPFPGWCIPSFYMCTSASGIDPSLAHRCQTYPEVLHSRYVLRSGVSTGDIMFFEYGVVVFWDLSNAQENSILQVIESR